MEEKKKKSGGRRAYLNDFLPNEYGEYEYKGRSMHFSGTAQQYAQMIKLSVVAALLMAVLTIVPEFLPSVPASRFPVSAVLWLAQLVSMGLTVYSVWKMYWGREPLREYIYKKSVLRLPGQTAVCFGASALLAMELIIYMLIKGTGDNVFPAIARPVAALICAAVSLQLHLMIKRSEWN